jgi:ABC-2 type transport system ATP-binding protein
MGVLAASAGRVLWEGRPITREDRQRYGYMPEERGLYPRMKVAEQLEYLARLHGMPAADARRSVRRWTERLGVADRAGDEVQKLSLGNQQRVQLAAALVHDPQVLVLDEPFSGLDPTAVDSMAALLREHTRRGVPVLFSSHQLDLVERLCDRLVIMARGRVVAKGGADALRDEGPVRYRFVLGGDAGWMRGRPGVLVEDVDGPAALVEVLESGAEQALLSEAARRGPVHEFARVVPRLSEIYQEVTA